jgi:hypothetical protein
MNPILKLRANVALACAAILAAATFSARAQTIPNGWSFAAWTSDDTSGVDGTKHYTHAYNFGSSVGTTINAIPFTGRAGGAPSVAGSFSTANYANLFNGDANNINAGGSAQLARDFVYGDGVNDQSITLLGLTPGTEYVFTLFTLGWEGAGARKAKFFFGEDSLIIDQDNFGDNNGNRISYRYVAAANSITLSWTPQQPASIHAYGFANYEATTPVPPSITGQPASQCVQAGQTAVFKVAAVGSDPLTYQWKKDGIDLDGEVSATLTIPDVDSSKAGVYTVVVHNDLDTVTSAGAKLEIGLNSLVNPSFEANSFTAFPGYVSGNGPITGWDALGGHGLNPASGSPFADNGAIPNGVQVAFMQADGAMSQIVGGFTPGLDYYVVYYENARSGPSPALEVKIADTTIVAAHLVSQVGGNNPYLRVDSDVFTATADTLQLSFIKSNPGGDTTALIDNVCIIEVPPLTAPTVTVQPKPLIVQVGESASFTVTAFGSQPFGYQWKSNGVDIVGATDRTFTIPSAAKVDEAVYSVQVDNSGGTGVSSGAKLTVWEPIADLYGTGLDAAHVPLADAAVDAHYKLTLNPDVAGSTDAFVEDSGSFPIVTGPWLPNNAKTKWIGPRFNTAPSAPGHYNYRTTIDLTDRDPSTVVIMGRWAVDNTGLDILVNGVSTGNPVSPGFGGYTSFVLSNSATVTFVAGINTIDFLCDNIGPAVGWTGLQVLIDKSNVTIPPGVPPHITGQPTGRKAVEDETVTFGVNATGSAPLRYQWKKDGVNLPGQTGPTLTLTGVLQADSGLYSVTVANDTPTVAVSESAALCVNMRRLQGVVFNTGVDDTGALLPTSSTDLHYILAQSVDPIFPGPDAIVVNDQLFPIVSGPWVASGPKSKWIGPQADESGANPASQPGDYTYQTFPDFTGYDVSQLKIIGRWSVDNSGLDILVNGASTGITSPGFSTFTPFTLSSGLVAGPNTIDFKINNGSPAGPTALRVELEVQVPIQPVLSIAPTAGGLRISWTAKNPCQVIKFANTITGPWTTIEGASSPVIIIPSEPARFYKVIEQ